VLGDGLDRPVDPPVEASRGQIGDIRHAVLYAACHDGVRHCQGSHRVFVEFLPGCGTSVHGSGEFFRTFLIVVLSPVMAVVMRIALLARMRSLKRHLSPFKLWRTVTSSSATRAPS
jgi:hypothetical protein